METGLPGRGAGHGGPLNEEVEMHPDTRTYNEALPPAERKVCALLAKEIERALPDAENKVWHAHPVWFLDGNPVVGYSRLKDGVRLLFWSGQSFQEGGLRKEGTFKAAEARYSTASQVDTEQLGRWLAEARAIQWDYRNLVRRKGAAHRSLVTVFGGETTVTVKGGGRGGRNRELALAAAFHVDGVKGANILVAGTDGVDNTPDAAGAFVDDTTLARAAERASPARRSGRTRTSAPSRSASWRTPSRAVRMSPRRTLQRCPPSRERLSAWGVRSQARTEGGTSERSR